MKKKVWKMCERQARENKYCACVGCLLENEFFSSGGKLRCRLQGDSNVSFVTHSIFLGRETDFRPSFWITLFGQYFHGWTHCAKSANYSHSSIIFVFVRQPHIRVTSLFCAGFLDFCTAIRFCFWYLVSLHTTPSRNREIGRKSK